MKKLYVLMSLVLLTVWVIGFFAMKASPVIHLFLFLSVLIYLHSIIMQNVAGTPVLQEKK